MALPVVAAGRSPAGPERRGAGQAQTAICGCSVVDTPVTGFQVYDKALGQLRALRNAPHDDRGCRTAS